MNRYRVLRYDGGDKMADLILKDYNMLLVIERFGISLGFKEHSIEEVCTEHNVDVATLLAVVNLLTNNDTKATDYSQISLRSLMEYIHVSHHYFIDYKLPSIREKLTKAVSSQEVLSKAVLNYFDEYVAEVKNHMCFEEESLFSYVNGLLNGDRDMEFDIESFSDHHEGMDSKMAELKAILIKYYPSQSSHDLSLVLVEIFSCEEELDRHARIEDYLLIPSIKELLR